MSTELRQPEQIATWNRRMAVPEYQRLEPEQQLLARIETPRSRALRALDIGCGWGRHLAYLASQGWRATGLDWSTVALTRAHENLEDQGLKADLVRGDFQHMPFNQAEFQLVVAVDVLQHCRLAGFRRALAEIKRVLRIGGKAIISVPSVRNAPSKITGEWVEDHTVVLLDSVEAGIPHHFFSREELQLAVRMFRNSSIEPAIEPLPGRKAPLHSEHVNEWYWVTLTG